MNDFEIKQDILLRIFSIFSFSSPSINISTSSSVILMNHLAMSVKNVLTKNFLLAKKAILKNNKTSVAMRFTASSPIGQTYFLRAF